MTRCQLLLSLLEDAGERGITTSEILEAGVGSRYGARLMELRKAGHRITSERVREGSWRYTLEVEVRGFTWTVAPRELDVEETALAAIDAEDAGISGAEVGGGGPLIEAPSLKPLGGGDATADLSAEALKLFESAA